MKGRPADWSAELANAEPAHLLDQVIAAGFDGLWVDRAGYADRGGALEEVVRANACGSAGQLGRALRLLRPRRPRGGAAGGAGGRSHARAGGCDAAPAADALARRVVRQRGA